MTQSEGSTKWHARRQMGDAMDHLAEAVLCLANAAAAMRWMWGSAWLDRRSDGLRGVAVRLWSA